MFAIAWFVNCFWLGWCISANSWGFALFLFFVCIFTFESAFESDNHCCKCDDSDYDYDDVF
jgi:hypothetical protein